MARAMNGRLMNSTGGHEEYGALRERKTKHTSEHLPDGRAVSPR